MGGAVPRGTLDPEPPEPPELPVDFPASYEALRAVLAASGAPSETVAAANPQEVARGMLGLTAGYDRDPATVILDDAREPTGGPAVTLTLDAPIRTACSRCWLPAFGRVSATWREGAVVGLPADRVLRLVECLSARLQDEGQLAEQVAAAAAGPGGASEVEVVVTLRRPCDECGSGQRETTARARRASPAGGDPPQQGGG